MLALLYIRHLLGFSKTFLEATRCVSGLLVHKSWSESWPFGVGGRPVNSIPLLCLSSTPVERWQKLGRWRLSCHLDLERGSKVKGGRKNCSQDSSYQMRILEGFFGLCVVCIFKEMGDGLAEGHKASIGQQL